MTPRAAILVTVATALPAGIAIAASPVLEVISYETRPGISKTIGDHARWNDSCRALDTPLVTIERAPTHGRVCVSRDMIMPVQSRSGRAANCVGHPMQGIQVIYFPQIGFSGPDTLRYGLDFPEGHVSREIVIDVTASDSSRPPGPDDPPVTPQARGRAPECSGQVS